jgi:hypothetical protein
MVEATKFVTCETVLVWSGVKSGGNDPADTYSRVDDLDMAGTLTVEAAGQGCGLQNSVVARQTRNPTTRFSSSDNHLSSA